MQKKFKHYRIVIFFLVFAAIGLVTSCTENVSSFKSANQDIRIYPDYAGITIPCNIAPLNFSVNEKASDYLAIFKSDGKEMFRINSEDGIIKVPEGKWKTLVKESAGKEYTVDICLKKPEGWVKYNTITNTISADSLDSYLVYRLIEPGFETWGKMGIYQRDLASFDESAIMENNMSNGNCMNCHSFSSNNSNTMLFHMRADNGGTYLYKNGKLEKLDTKTDSTLGPGVYPSWNPDGNHVAFSTNRIVQTFHAIPDKKVEVLDTLSDVIVYDVSSHTIFTNNSIASKGRFETFPSWSPDGKSLYFCSAKAVSPRDYKNIRYDLLKIEFNPQTNQFGTVDTVYKAAIQGKSISLPRVSPDGKYVMFCMSDYGTFSIWHPESDLYLLNLGSGEIRRLEINSQQTESYHTWSSTGKWLVFSSRRMDGLYTRPYFSHFQSDGSFSKPFILPQEKPDFYERFLKSYNIPELVKSKVPLNPRIIAEKMKQKAINVKFVSSH
jgi:Periplasmic component of the Tol biopolymer transport system